MAGYTLQQSIEEEKLDFFSPIFIMALIAAAMSDFVMLVGVIGLLIPAVGLIIMAFAVLFHYFAAFIVGATVFPRAKGWLANLLIVIAMVVPLPLLCIGIVLAYFLSNKFIAFLAEQVLIIAASTVTFGGAAVVGEAAEGAVVAGEVAEGVTTMAEGTEAVGAAAEGAEAVSAGAEVTAAGTEAAGETAEAGEVTGEKALKAAKKTGESIERAKGEGREQESDASDQSMGEPLTVFEATEKGAFGETSQDQQEGGKGENDRVVPFEKKRTSKDRETSDKTLGEKPTPFEDIEEGAFGETSRAQQERGEGTEEDIKKAA